SSYHSVPTQLPADTSRLRLWTAALFTLGRRSRRRVDRHGRYRVSPGWSRLRCCRPNVAIASAADLTSHIFETKPTALGSICYANVFYQQSLPRTYSSSSTAADSNPQILR